MNNNISGLTEQANPLEEIKALREAYWQVSQENKSLRTLRKTVETRILYLRDKQVKEIGELEGMEPGTLERKEKWRLIKELAHRRHELEELISK